MLLGLVDGFLNRLLDVFSFGHTDRDTTFAVADDDSGTEAETLTAFGDTGYAGKFKDLLVKLGLGAIAAASRSSAASAAELAASASASAAESAASGRSGFRRDWRRGSCRRLRSRFCRGWNDF